MSSYLDSDKIYVPFNDNSAASLYGSVGYRPDGLTNWFNALKNAKTTPVNIVVVGDSIGVLNVFGSTLAWPWRLAQLMADKGRTTADTVHLRYPKPTGNQAPYMTSCEGALTSPVSGMGAQAVDLTNGQKATMTATMDGISVIYTKKSGGGSLQVRDGEGGTLLTTIDTSGTAKASNVWTSDALTLASHTIEITSVGNTVLEGVYVHNGTRDKGVRVWSASISGYTSKQLTDTPSFALDLISNINPDLVILATGTNDGVANYADYMGGLISAVEAVHDGDIAIWFPYPSSAGFPTSEETPARAYRDTLDLPIIDAGVGCANISTLYSVDGVHPTDLGHSMLANQVYSVIGGDPIGEMALRRSIVENNLSDLDTAKAPKASPTFTGTVTAPTISFAGGNGSISNFLGAPFITMIDTSNTQPQYHVGSAALNNFLYSVNAPGIFLGSGSATVDTNLYRDAANSWKTDDKMTAALGFNMGTAGVGVPASAGATGVKGDIAFDSSYIYICTATNTWKRVAIATW